MKGWSAVAVALGLVTAPGAPAQSTEPDHWAPIRFLVGTWTGTAVGNAGEGSVARQYEFVMRRRYLHERNTSTYPQQEKNPKGEVHEHWSLFSYDKLRKRLVLRQFHVEGFVNQYVLDTTNSSAKRLVFVSESIENFAKGWRAREIYEIAGPDEFTETFELAPPDKSFEIYGVSKFTRKWP